MQGSSLVLSIYSVRQYSEGIGFSAFQHKALHAPNCDSRKTSWPGVYISFEELIRVWLYAKGKAALELFDEAAVNLGYSWSGRIETVHNNKPGARDATKYSFVKTPDNSFWYEH